MYTVTATISVYNGEKYIIRCLESLINQSRKFDEIIVYNDASTDATTKMVECYVNEHPETIIKLIDSNINRGPGGGKNYVMKFVTTDYFTFVDADDYVGRCYLEHLLEPLKQTKEHQNIDIVFGGFCKENHKGEVIYKRIFVDVDSALVGGFQNWGNLYSKAFFEKNEVEIPEGKVLEDVLTRAVIIGHDPVCRIAEGYSDYYYVDNSESVSKTYMNSFVEGVMRLEMDYLSGNKEKVLRAKYDLYEYYAYKTLIWHLLKSGSGVGWKAMKQELEEGYDLFVKAFPNFKGNKYIKNKAPKGERPIVKFAIKLMYIAEELRIQKFLMYLYSSVSMHFLWPNM